MPIPSTVFTAALLLGLAPKLAAADVNATAKQALATLPGNTAFLFTELTADGPQPLYGVNEKERFAVGSSFKLYILGRLAEEVNDDRRQLADVMKLEKKFHGPPASELADWPIGSPVTLNTLALKMISISDNTATDHLLHLLGREEVERQMAKMGHSHPEWNMPLLSTREMTLLRDKSTGLLGEEYQKLDEAARRKFLEKLSQTPDYEKLDFDAAAYNLAEWYATPMDMARALAWIKKETGKDRPAHLLRGDIAVETKLPHDSGIWPYVGFKGGSEDQLICGNWLLKNRNGKWYTLHVYYNSPDKKVDEGQFVKVVGQLLGAVQRAVE